MPDKLLVSATEAAKMLSISRASLYAYVDRGLLPKPLKIGKRVLWSVEELREWIAKQRRG